MRKLILMAIVLLTWSAQAAKPPKVPKTPPGPKSGHQLEVLQFEATAVCPATGSAGKCPGYVVGFIRPLECGGTDTALNMRWLTPEAAKAIRNTVRKSGCGKNP